MSLKLEKPWKTEGRYRRTIRGLGFRGLGLRVQGFSVMKALILSLYEPQLIANTSPSIIALYREDISLLGGMMGVAVLRDSIQGCFQETLIWVCENRTSLRVDTFRVES